MTEAALAGGFADAPREAAQAFRSIMTAMARPGTILEIAGATPPGGLSLAAGAVLLTLCDPDTPVWMAPALETPDIRRWIDFHTGARRRRRPTQPLLSAHGAIFRALNFPSEHPTIRTGQPHFSSKYRNCRPTVQP